jgi:predicted O-linked N-acetylglucosamine transferase (SPINDLY family)
LKPNGSDKNLRAEAERRGVDPNRLIAAPQLPQTPHLRRLQNADISLDTLPVNAHTTTSDAVWAGVPVVTLPGEPFVSRVAGSIMTTLGLPELIAKDREDYYRIAKELATHPNYLEDVKRRVREGRSNSALFDSARYTRNLETLYRLMWRRRAAGLAPTTIDINGELT